MNFENFINSPLYSDGVLQTCNSKYFIHKIILSKSTYFQSLFQDNLQIYNVDLKDASLTGSLNFLYNPSLTITRENLVESFKISIEFGLTELGRSCVEFLKTLTDLDTYLSLARVSPSPYQLEIIDLITTLPVIEETCIDLGVSPSFSKYLVILALDDASLIPLVDIDEWTETEINVAIDDGVLNPSLLQARLHALKVDPDSTIKASVPLHRSSSAQTLPDIDLWDVLAHKSIYAPVAVREVCLPKFLKDDFLDCGVEEDEQSVKNEDCQVLSGQDTASGTCKPPELSYEHFSGDLQEPYNSNYSNGYNENNYTNQPSNFNEGYTNPHSYSYPQVCSQPDPYVYYQEPYGNFVD